VAWLGDLPDTWSAVPLKQRTSLISRGRSPDYSEDEQGVPIINQACIYWDGIRYDNVKWQRQSTLFGERGRLRQGDLLMNSTGTGTLGRVAVFDRPGEYLADTHVTVIRATKDAVSSFLRYVLQTGIYQGYVYSVLAPGATNQIELSREGLRRTPFPMPPVGEQQFIAAFLDRKTAAIDTLIVQKERQIELLQEKQQAFITQAITRGMDPRVPTKNSGIEWMGQIPRHWGVKRLRHISPRIGVGVVVSPSQYVSVEGVPFLYGADVGEGFLRAQDARRISPEDSRRLAVSQLHTGDLVTIRVGATRGWTAVIPPEFEGANCASIMITRRHSSFCSDWLCLAMNSRLGMAQIEAIEYGAAQPQFNISHATEFWFPVPPLAEQRAIASTVLSFQGDDRSRQALVGASIERLREYRQALITAAVTGKIDVSKEAA
jgi:type I restriction enzyme S subunit